MANYVIGVEDPEAVTRHDWQLQVERQYPDLDRREPEHGQQAVELSSQGGARTGLIAKRGLGEQEASCLSGSYSTACRRLRARTPRSTSSGRPRKG